MLERKKKRLPASQIVLIVFVALLAVLVLYPFVLLLVKSLKDYDQEIDAPLALTAPFHWENYKVAWTYVKDSIVNSLFVSCATSFVTVALSAMGAYGFSRHEFFGKNVLYMACVALMMIPGILILTTKYYLVSVTLRLQDNFLGVILPSAAGLLPFGLLLLRGYFDELPQDLFDAAKIDGASSVRQFLRILLPLAMPMLMTLFLMNFMTSWNDYLWPLMLLRDESMYTIPVRLQSFTDYFYKMTQYYAPPFAGYVIVSLPILVLFGFTSKQFIRGMTSGAFKM